MRLLAERYGGQWEKLFGGIRTKKAQWQELSDLGLGPGSMGTFYRHGADYMQYVRNGLCFSRVPIILARLAVHDEEILANLETVKLLQDAGV